jgi:hypothetical protein
MRKQGERIARLSYASRELAMISHKCALTLHVNGRAEAISD